MKHNVLYCISEQEADAEEERLRKERERQQKQDVMTLGETREQIATLEGELSQLKAEKHQLFLQLKKVLNEDDRRRQLIKETRFASQLQLFKGLSGIIFHILYCTFITCCSFSLGMSCFVIFAQKDPLCQCFSPLSKEYLQAEII